ncbi:hypothetical protein CSUI_000422 [Cystoisospora suis]|uniref:Uncharacterized protein n=1 Tax=Cystoisospora suis TaxID=483139 RepID=A0A2C6LGD4_9APIC|nr:hypothetical protein CSUI_000422 [Cystoisospora suis]
MAATNENELESEMADSLPPSEGHSENQTTLHMEGVQQQHMESQPGEQHTEGDQEENGSRTEEAEKHTPLSGGIAADETDTCRSQTEQSSVPENEFYSSDGTLPTGCQAASCASSSSYPSCSSPSSSSQTFFSLSSSSVPPPSLVSAESSLASEAAPPSVSPLKREEGLCTPSKEGVRTPQKDEGLTQGKQASPTSSDLFADEIGDPATIDAAEGIHKEPEHVDADPAFSPSSEKREDNSANKPAKSKALSSSSYAYGLWPENPSPSSSENRQPSLLHLAAACKKLTKESQAADFVATLSADDKIHLQRRYHRVNRHIACLPPLRPMPQDKFRVGFREVKSKPKKEDVVELLEEQEKQLRKLQPHDVVFAHLYSQLRELFPERGDAALYEVCRRVCAEAKKENRKDVLAPLKRTLLNARFALAREQRKLRSHSTAPEDV